MQAGQGKVQVSGNLGGLRRSLSGRPLNNGVRSESGSSVPGWQGGGGADSGAIGDDGNAASRDAGTREPGGHYSGLLVVVIGSMPVYSCVLCWRVRDGLSVVNGGLGSCHDAVAHDRRGWCTAPPGRGCVLPGPSGGG